MDTLIKNFFKENSHLNIFDLETNFFEVTHMINDYIFKVMFVSYVDKCLTLGRKDILRKRKKYYPEIPILNFSSDNSDTDLSSLMTSEEIDFESLIFDFEENFEFDNIISDEILLSKINSLTEYQKKILYLHSIKEMNDTQISDLLNVSRQAINKNRKKIIKKLN